MKRLSLQNEHGVAMLEATVVFPFLFVMLIGIVEISRAVHLKNTIESATRAGAEYGAQTLRGKQNVTANYTLSNADTADIASVVQSHFASTPGLVVTTQIVSSTGGNYIAVANSPIALQVNVTSPQTSFFGGGWSFLRGMSLKRTAWAAIPSA